MPTPAANKICICCRSEVTPTASRAHVWRAPMGWRDTNCEGYNNTLGPIEDTFRESLNHSFASVGTMKEDREPINVAIGFACRKFVLADGNAEMQVVEAHFDHDLQSMVVSLPAALDNQVEALARAMWSHDLGSDDVHKLNLSAGDLDPTLSAVGTRHEPDLSLSGSIEHKRVLLKMAVELLAVHRHDLAMRSKLSDARRVARDGSGTFSEPARHALGRLPSAECSCGKYTVLSHVRKERHDSRN